MKMKTKTVFFYMCIFILSFSAKASATYVGAEIHSCGDYEYVVLDDGTAQITDYFGEGSIYIPSKLDGVKVTSIGNWAFGNNSSLTDIHIPDSIIAMEGNPFCNCSSLQSVNVTIDNSAFATIDGVLFGKSDKRLIWYPQTAREKTYSIPQGIKIIGENSFRGCSSLTNIIIPDSVESISNYAFIGCESLAEIIIPDSVLSIGDYAFMFCNSLTEVTIPDCVSYMGRNPFNNCISLENIYVSLDSPYFAVISGGFFCKPDRKLICYPPKYQASSYIIPQGIQSIGDSAFNNCSSLMEVTIPDSVTTIENQAFYGCISLTAISIPEGISTIGKNAFTKCKSLIEIYIPDSVTTIGEQAFSDCISLTSINIPESVLTIGDSAFGNCKSLKDISIPSSVIFIGKEAFSGCNNIMLHVERETYAAQYAADNGVAHEYPDPLDWLHN